MACTCSTTTPSSSSSFSISSARAFVRWKGKRVHTPKLHFFGASVCAGSVVSPFICLFTSGAHTMQSHPLSTRNRKGSECEWKREMSTTTTEEGQKMKSTTPPPRLFLGLPLIPVSILCRRPCPCHPHHMVDYRCSTGEKIKLFAQKTQLFFYLICEMCRQRRLHPCPSLVLHTTVIDRLSYQTL